MEHSPADFALEQEQITASRTDKGVGSGPWLGGLVFAGCKDHPHRTDLSCCKIRRADGTPMSVADTWAEIHRLRSGIDCATNALTDSILCSGNDAATNMHFVRKLKALLSAPNDKAQP